MKKYILSLICIVYNLVAFSSENTVSSFNAPPKPIKITISFIIARPALNCEEGFGICNLSAGAGRAGGDGRRVGAQAYVENGQFTIEILKSQTDSKLEDELSELEYYTVSDEVVIPDEIVAKLGLKGDYSIPEGRYRIIKYAEYFEVNFDLK